MPREGSSRAWSATPCSSAYFQSSSQLHTPSNSASTVRLEEQALEDNHGRPPQYTPSMTSTRPSTSHTSISRTTTRPKSRTATTSSILGLSDQQNVICAVAEARGVTPSVGVAFVNVSLGEVILSQICDNQSYVKTIHKIQMASPSRIVFMSTACPPVKPSTLYSLVQELVPEAHCDAFDRSAWSETAGLDYVQTLAFPSDVEPVKVAIHGKYYAVSSFAAVSTCPRLLYCGT